MIDSELNRICDLLDITVKDCISPDLCWHVSIGLSADRKSFNIVRINNISLEDVESCKNSACQFIKLIKQKLEIERDKPIQIERKRNDI